MRQLSNDLAPSIPRYLVTIGLACLVLLGSAVAANGTDLEKQDIPQTRLVVPFFEVDTTNPAGTTTLFAIRNLMLLSADVDITYFRSNGTAQRTDTVTLDADATHTVNVRDVTGLATDPDGVARGFIIIGSAKGLSLVGDFFQVDIGESFANGERMIPTSMCPETEIRFADFGDGTEVIVLLTSPEGTNPATDPASFRVTPVDEAGNAGTPTDVYTDQHLYLTSASDFTTGAFGTLIFDFSPEGTFGGGWAYAVYSAGGRFSVGMGSATDSARRRCPSLSPSQASADLSQSIRDEAARALVKGVPGETLAGGFEPQAVAVDEPAIGSRLTSLLVLPFFQVDKANPNGTTTLYAIRNVESDPIEVEIDYYPLDSPNPVQSETVTLAAGTTRTVNLRDVPGLSTDPDGFARGFATIEGVDTGQIVGDFFQVDVAKNFASGDRLISKRSDLCGQQETRFADFGSGTDLMLVLTNPRGNFAQGVNPSVRVTPIDEAGNRLPSTDIYTDQFVYFAKASDFTDESFGTLVFEFSIQEETDQGWVYGVYSADGRFSVGLNGVRNPFSPDGALCHDASSFPLPPS